jgi:hypothetical protein
MGGALRDEIGIRGGTRLMERDCAYRDAMLKRISVPMKHEGRIGT